MKPNHSTLITQAWMTNRASTWDSDLQRTFQKKSEHGKLAIKKEKGLNKIHNHLTATNMNKFKKKMEKKTRYSNVGLILILGTTLVEINLI
jgi:hypothetical protein